MLICKEFQGFFDSQKKYPTIIYTRTAVLYIHAMVFHCYNTITISL